MTKKKHIILWSVLAVVALLIIVAVLYADKIVTSIADGELRKALNKNENIQVDYSDLRVRLMAGSISAKDITCRIVAKEQPLKDTIAQQISVGYIDVHGINWFRLRKKQLDIHNISVRSPRAEIILPPKQKNRIGATADTAEVKKSNITNYISSIEVDKVKISGGAVNLKKLENKFALQADSLDLKINDLQYDLAEKNFTYNDSVYSVALRNFSLTSSDGLFAVAVGSAKTEDAGKVKVKKLHLNNTCKKENLAKAKGKVPVTWVDAEIAELTTSDVNLIRQAVNKSVDIEKIDIFGKKVQLYRDTQYPPKKPYKMLQEAITNIPIPVHIGEVKLALTNFAAGLTRDGNHVGKLALSDVHLNADDFSNASGNVLKTHLNGNLSGTKADIHLNLKNDKACTFTYAFEAKDLKGSAFDDFLHPISGATLSANIHSVNIQTQGDKNLNVGTFCMLYDSLHAHINKEDAPIERLAKNAGVINFFAPAIIHKSNPRSPNAQPYVAPINNPRNPQKNFMAYIMSPFMDGIMHTVLPEGIYQSIKKNMTANNPPAKK